MSTWNLYTLNSSDVWVLDSTIPRPNEDLQAPIIHNQQERQLADGSFAFFTPETRATKDAISMSWLEQDKNFVDQLTRLIEDHEYIKIETHIPSYTYIGRFISMTPTWLVGRNEVWNVNAIFKRMEG